MLSLTGSTSAALTGLCDWRIVRVPVTAQAWDGVSQNTQRGLVGAVLGERVLGRGGAKVGV